MFLKKFIIKILDLFISRGWKKLTENFLKNNAFNEFFILNLQKNLKKWYYQII